MTISTSADGESKPTPVTLTISVKDMTGDELFLKVKKTTPMLKVFKAYASRKGVSVSALRFLIDGDRVDPDKTPESLGLEEHDQIDCMLNQNGGGREGLLETERAIGSMA